MDSHRQLVPADDRGARPEGRLRDARITGLEAALAAVGDRWSLSIAAALLDGPLRFSDLSRAVDGIAPNILIDRLRRLGGAGVVASTPYSERPLRLEYRLTQEGHELAGVLRLLAGWGSQRSDEDGPRHSACGTVMEARLYCPTCARAVDESQGSDLVRL